MPGRRIHVAPILPVLSMLALLASPAATLGVRDAQAAVLPRAIDARDWRWGRVVVPNGGARLTAVAVDAASGSIAVGDEQGILVRIRAADGDRDGDGRGGAQGDRHREAGDVERSSDPAPSGSPAGWHGRRAMGAVTDLHFSDSGDLWIGGLEGLWLLGSDGRVEDRSPAVGQGAGWIHRIDSAGELVVVATEAGAFATTDARSWQRIVYGLPRGPVRAVAIREVPDRAPGPRALEIWLVCAGDLWRLRATVESGGFELSPARRESISGRPAGDSPVDLAVGLPGVDLAVLYPRAMAGLRTTANGDRAWEVWYPVMLPGAVPLRITGAHGQAWLATDRGLLASSSYRGPWHRTASPAGSAAIFAMAGARDAMLAIGEIGLLEASLLDAARAPERAGGKIGMRSAPSNTTSALARARPGPSTDPQLRTLHERALAYNGLLPEYFRGLRKSIGRRGWMPILGLRVAGAYDRDTNDDRDQSFSYGELHDLRDRGSSRSRDFAGSITLSWDFADLMYPEDAPDLSREGRQVVTLRDNLLDEINLLYFDRQRTLLALSAFADRSDPEAVALELRARELAAGIDAWTGGWFSQQLEAQAGRAESTSDRWPEPR